MLENFISLTKEKFPHVSIKYKNESKLMKILSLFLFFNKDFMTKFTTTLGNDIYFPSKEFLEKRSISSLITLLHELVHVYDYNKQGKIWFSLKYLFPQILSSLSLVMVFFNPLLAIMILSMLLPWPAYFRMQSELRAYYVSLYASYYIGIRLGFEPHLEDRKEIYLKAFRDSSYYFMWWASLEEEFNTAIKSIKSGGHPFYDNELFDKIDDIISKL